MSTNTTEQKSLKKFIQHVESLENSDDDFSREYALIQDAQIRNHRDNVCSMDAGKLENNLKKNRYKDIVPYDDHRITLRILDGDQTSDYINASKIIGVAGSGDYIASQGPLSGTVNDFWRMIWEYNVEIIFMACRLVEMKKVKCSQYWGAVDMSVDFGDITVYTESEKEILPECFQRTFRVTKGNEVHKVKQFHYCGWPDHGIPENVGDIHDIIHIMRQTRQNSRAPLLIHCSAGCGRTGTIIAIDYVWTLIEEGKFDENFSLFDLICNFREQRMSLVQTPDQYALVNKVLKTVCEDKLIQMHTYENVNFIQVNANDDEEKTKDSQKPPRLEPKVAVNTALNSSKVLDRKISTGSVKYDPSAHKPQSQKSQEPFVSRIDLTSRSYRTPSESSSPKTSQQTAEKDLHNISRRWSSLKIRSTVPESSSYLPRNTTPPKSFLQQKNSTPPLPRYTVQSMSSSLPRNTTPPTSFSLQRNTAPPSSTIPKNTSQASSSSLVRNIIPPAFVPLQRTSTPPAPKRIYNIPAKSESEKVFAGRTFNELSRRCESRSLKLVHGDKERHSSTRGSDVQNERQLITDSRVKFRAQADTAAVGSEMYRGFVRLNSRNSSTDDYRKVSKKQ